jgi:FG-GAP-like repeat/IPT/TIG domain/Secretion system C-terminal sorting domain/FG-GAP repeat
MKPFILSLLALLPVLGVLPVFGQPVPGGPFLSTSFMTKTQVTTGIYPHSVVPADFNGDGKVDLFVARGSSSVNTVLPNTSVGGNMSFGAPVQVANSGTDEEGAAAGDLDGDGKPDLVVTNGVGGASISIYRNTSTGSTISFAPRVDLPVVGGPYGVTIGDLDGDGKPDIVVANNGANQVSFYRNTSVAGSLSFAARLDITVGSTPFGIAIGDLDGDGKPDIVVNGEGPVNSLFVLQNNSTPGQLAFGTPIDIAYTGGGFNAVIGDFDGDGKPDIAVAASGIQVFRNLSTPGNFSFSGAQVFDGGAYVYYIAVADLDGDGKPDLSAAIGFSNTVVALHNTSGSGTISFDGPVSYGAGADPRYLALGDVDGDGRPDMLVANTADTAISVLRNLIGANESPVVLNFTPSSGVSGTVVTITGQNLVGVTGVSFGGVPAASFTVNSATGITAVVGGGASGVVGITNAIGEATQPGFVFNGPIISRFSPAVGQAGTVVKIGGLNFTGATAVAFGGVAAASFAVDSAEGITAILASGASGAVTVTTPNGVALLAGFSFGVPSITAVAPVSAVAGATVTLSGSNFGSSPSNNIVYFGAVRAVVLSASAMQLTVRVPAGATYGPLGVTVNGLTGVSPQAFSVASPNPSPTIDSSSFAVAGIFPTGSVPSVIALSDLDGDGKTDIVLVNSTGNSLSVLANQSQVGKVALAPAIQLPVGADPNAVAIGDLDGDGRPDIVAVNFNSGNWSTMSIFLNTSVAGAIQFGPRMDIATGQGSSGVAIGDLNGDGRPDIIVASGNSGWLSVFLNTSTGAGAASFAPAVNYTAFDHSQSIAIVDLDQDGRPDIVTADFNNTMTVYQNASVGGVLTMVPLPVYQYDVETYPQYVSAGDLDGDGLPDVVMANYGAKTISLIRNYSNGGNISLMNYNNIQVEVTPVSFGDINGDGKVDLVAGNVNNGAVSVFQNTVTAPGYLQVSPNVDFSLGAPTEVFAAVGDLDGDGKPDIVATALYRESVTVLRNRIGDPVIGSFSPDSAVKGDTVTIRGRNFAGMTAVMFGGVPASRFTVVDSTTIEAVVGAGGSGVVSVVSATGVDTAGGFRFIPQVNPGGPVVACAGVPVVLVSTAAAGNQWYKDGVLLSGSTRDSLVVVASGYYQLRVGPDGVSTAADSGVRVTVVDIDAPVITRDLNGELVSSDTLGNQWMVDGASISGATFPTYRPSGPGNYTVQSTVGVCVSAVSAPYALATGGQINLGNGQYLSLAPNPVQNSLSIFWNINGNALLDVVVTDLQGRQMLAEYNVANGTVLDLSGLPKGVYNVKVYSSGSLNFNKSIKILKL